MKLAALLLTASLTCFVAHAQDGKNFGFDPNPIPAVAPLPSNYKTIFENPDVLVMHVHYGAHEFVPMHDHPAVATLYVYLNDSGEVDIIHEGPNAVTAHRPPTHTGAFRIAPGIAERHSVQSNSDTDSDFLRVEFKRITFPDLPEVGKHIAAPVTPTPGTHIEFENPNLRIERVICAPDHPCQSFVASNRALLIALNTTRVLHTDVITPSLATGQVQWLTPDETPYALTPGSQALLVSFLDAAPPASNKPCRF